MSEFEKVSNELIHSTQLVFSTNNELSEREIKENFTFTIAP